MRTGGAEKPGARSAFGSRRAEGERAGFGFLRWDKVPDDAGGSYERFVDASNKALINYCPFPLKVIFIVVLTIF